MTNTVAGHFDHAETLRQDEFALLGCHGADAGEPALSNPTQLRARVAGMLERLGYELLTPATFADMQATKKAASTSSPSPPPQIRCRRRSTISRDCTSRLSERTQPAASM